MLVVVLFEHAITEACFDGNLIEPHKLQLQLSTSLENVKDKFVLEVRHQMKVGFDDSAVQQSRATRSCQVKQRKSVRIGKRRSEVAAESVLTRTSNAPLGGSIVLKTY